MTQGAAPNKEDVEAFAKLIDENRYNFVKLVYIIFPFGQPGHELEHLSPYPWQLEELAKLSKHLQDPKTRYELYRLIVSSGNGAAKTALGAMIVLCLLYTQQLKGRITANTDPQLKGVIWPEYDKWLHWARFSDVWFEKLGTSIKARKEEVAETWRVDLFTWDPEQPQRVSGLHNRGRASVYVFEEAPGIPAIIWKYANGAFSDPQTIMIWLAFGNSDDPESEFEHNMESPLWNARRIDTRTLDHIPKKFVDDLLFECNGDENHDDFRVRIRGLPRKTAKDSIISQENIEAAWDRRKGFDKTSVGELPCILTCDPAWQGGDECAITYRQGHYSCLLDVYKLDKASKETHWLTYQKLVYWESKLRADAVILDQAEGTAVYSFAVNANKDNWFLIAFASEPNDKPDKKESEYGNIRAQMYYEFNKFLQGGGILDVNPEIENREKRIEEMKKQLSWARGTRHKVTMKKMVESKIEIKDRMKGKSPDIADGFVLQMAIPVLERKPENIMRDNPDHLLTGQQPYHMPPPDIDKLYEDIDANYHELYND